MSWRVLLVDDEPLARRRLAALLQPEPDFEVVAEASDADDARQALQNHRPDLMFLDIQMPGQNGLEMDAEMGPIVTGSARDRIPNTIVKGAAGGADLLVDGRGWNAQGLCGGFVAEWHFFRQLASRKDVP